MTRTHGKSVTYPSVRIADSTPASAGKGIEQRRLKMIEGRWKLTILFHLFDGELLRFSDLERAIPSDFAKRC